MLFKSVSPGDEMLVVYICFLIILDFGMIRWEVEIF